MRVDTPPLSLRAADANPGLDPNPPQPIRLSPPAHHAPTRAPASLHRLAFQADEPAGGKRRAARGAARAPTAIWTREGPYAGKRIHLSNALQNNREALGNVLERRSHLARELGDVPDVRAERDGLAEALSQSVRERTAVRDELIERELHSSGAWARDTVGERPDGLRAGEVWEHGVRLAARYRVEHDITGPGDALGPQPEQREWERAYKAIARDQRQLGRDVGLELDVGLDIGF